MSYVIVVSRGERAEGALRAETADLARAALKENGFVILRGAFAVEAVDAMHQEFAAQWGGCTLSEITKLVKDESLVLETGDKRFEIVVRMSGAFGQNAFGNPLVLSFLETLMGSVVLSSFTVVASYPGADAQRIHRDHASLFPELKSGEALPFYAISVSVPLIDIDIEMGPTGFLIGSQALPDDFPLDPDELFSMAVQRGDAILIDYRTFHGGLANLSTVVRPLLYMVYARPWFFDEINHIERPPLNMPLVEYQLLPNNLKPIATRAYSIAVRAKMLAPFGS